jgi:hypothetical protein
MDLGEFNTRVIDDGNKFTVLKFSLGIEKQMLSVALRSVKSGVHCI